ncbi:MAG: glycine cleavage system protein GcvH [Verrucomicrobiota bacterium]
MSQIPENLKYTETHEWVKIENDIAIIGITDHAQEELSDVVYVELPEKGALTEEQSTAAVVESVKAASDIYAPLKGEIIEVNESLADDPSLVNSSPYENGWIFKIKIDDASAAKRLKSSQEYEEHLG